MNRILWLTAGALTLIPISAAQARTWTDRSGRYSLEAEYLDFRDGRAVLLMSDGKTINVAVDKLSEVDRRLVRRQAPPIAGQDAILTAIEQLGGTVEIDASGNQQVISVDLSRTRITNDGLAAIKPLVWVEKLYLENTDITDAGLDALSDLKQLHTLYLYDSKITDAGLEKLQGLRNLERLYLMNTATTDAGMAHLTGLKRLSTLYITGTSVTCNGILALRSALPQLTLPGMANMQCSPPSQQDPLATAIEALGGTVEYDARSPDRPIIGVDLSDAGPLELSLTNDESMLAGVSTGVTDDDVAMLAGLTSLRRLSLAGRGVGDAAIASLVDSNLETLDLRFTLVGDAGVAELAKISTLRTLGLSTTEISDAGLAPLGRLPDLEVLYLSFTAIGNRGMRHLRGLAKLQHLDLTDTGVGDRGLAEFSELGELRSLDLTLTSVTSAGVAHLTPLANLESLSLRHTAVDDGAVAALSQLKGLRSLDLTGTKVTDAGMASLRKALTGVEIAR